MTDEEHAVKIRFRVNEVNAQINMLKSELKAAEAAGLEAYVKGLARDGGHDLNLNYIHRKISL